MVNSKERWWWSLLLFFNWCGLLIYRSEPRKFILFLLHATRWAKTLERLNLISKRVTEYVAIVMLWFWIFMSNFIFKTFKRIVKNLFFVLVLSFLRFNLILLSGEWLIITETNITFVILFFLFMIYLRIHFLICHLIKFMRGILRLFACLPL